MSTTSTKEQISFDQFLEMESKLDIRIGTVKFVERIPKSDKMLKLTVSFGDGKIRTVATNIGNRINDPQDLVMVQFPFIMNLAPSKMMGVVSEAMIMVVENAEGKLELEQFTDGSKLL